MTTSTGRRAGRGKADVSSLADAAISKKLKSSCLDAKDRKGLAIAEADPAELESWGQPAKMAMELPYFDVAGRPTGFKRIRYLEATLEGFASLTDAKERRYVQPPDTLPRAYFPTYYDWQEIADEPSIDVFVTEGELKAACCCKADRPTIGLGGVWSFKSSKASRTLIDDLKLFTWSGRRVTIVFDSDSRTNPGVAKACNALAEELLDRGAKVFVAEVPAGEDGDKQGIDDFALAFGFEALQKTVDAGTQFEASQVLHQLNAEVAYVRDPGMVHVYATGQKMRPSDFTGHAYANRHIVEWTEDKEGNRKARKLPAAKAWMEWQHRGEFSRMTFAPGQPARTGKDELNTWPGWGCEPKRGSVEPWRRLLDHLFEGHREERQWFERWLALPLQRPGSKMYTAAVVWGVKTGTGKSLVGYSMKRIYGKTFTEIGDTELQDSKMAWAANMQFVLGDDVTGHEQRQLADRLKKMITQETMRIDEKYVPTYVLPDYINYYFTSNHPDAFFLEDDDRRMFVHEVTCDPLPEDFYIEYMKWLNGDGKAALFYHLLNLDLGDMRAEGRAPKTEAKVQMSEDGLSNLGLWVRQLKDDPDTVLVYGTAKLTGDLWTSKQLLKLFDPEEKTRVTMAAMSRELKRSGFKMAYGGAQLRTTLGQVRLFAVRNRPKWEKCRNGMEMVKHFDDTRGDPVQRKRKF